MYSNGYIITSDGLVSVDELRHYGVLGMKWGVHRGRAKQAYEKASKKLNKLADKADKSQTKADKKLAKAVQAQYGWGLRDAKKAKWKAGREQYKADKKKKKVVKYMNKMEKVFKNTTVKMSKNQYDLGKKYIEQLKKRSDASSRLFL